mgnify:CR=1 FL=1
MQSDILHFIRANFIKYSQYISYSQIHYHLFYPNKSSDKTDNPYLSLTPYPVVVHDVKCFPYESNCSIFERTLEIMSSITPKAL